MKYDAIVVLGAGVNDNGTLNPRGEARAVKTAELLKNEEAPVAIFCGKWSHKRKTLPLITEAAAIAKRAVELGVKEKQVLLEEDSMMTGTNICNAKTKYLVPNGWTNIIVVTSPLLTDRSKINLENILGPDYHFKIVPTNLHWTPEEAKTIENSEREKMKKSVEFFSDITPGDHVSAYKKALRWSEQGL
ncbi:hypothetical protein A3A71_00065 [Candidatus Berkelbacteria bacterium RIFCSPLOWO2_01_FULL_50_28]|uniref:DUF218 domain-containing protein n=1 Tax=Candidatus Berkelbacteria bacterium RIFCSPLOWO2_01_FULL_50_28 TaxID=1797471 RepID=A0A1F5EAK5_9BACT|nr:MAG: hypothetical protein A2807_03230 [Candidatus Berkelbacteria bacterium RIFCSPHIGHO2_01_FULL_50_36]OGD62412.1 MAG: hypothetical protein A3F39_01765 [Candidatus Berkelbacteria bacterium RIFCSPHIGHO2_12_FULL_50_11]OGD64447.1 MAG: hypothetical protein A3A71_00065 [Candidatus Berkelbacteria bacterium RIFCSPLOWO2_01_FULL_50_28]